jgi:uncharacterized membrane protein YedE/YeeE
MRFFSIALMMALFVAFAAAPGMLSVNADTLDEIMDIVIGVISDAAFYIGIVIVLWGAFQIILAFRREDSEGISKQITTVVVGGVLVGFGSIADELYTALKGE